MNNIFGNILSGISILISIIALIYSVKTSYNPTIKVEALYTKDTIKINKFFGFSDKKIYEYLFPESIKNFVLFIPHLIILFINTLKYKKLFACGVQYNTNFSFSSVVLWVRITNPSKYPITIYNIICNNFLKKSYNYSLENRKFTDMVLYLKNKDEDVQIIRKECDDFLKLPIKIEPFSYVEKYLILRESNFFYSLRKYMYKRIKIKIMFYTSTKRISKRIKIYNGDKKLKDADICLKFYNFENLND